VTIDAALFSSASDEWATPQATFDALNEEFGFTLDACATADNAKCTRYYTKEQDGLAQDWSGEIVWMNPPYSAIKAWISKAWQEGHKPRTTVVCLIPARTDTAYWWDYVMTAWPHGIRFIRGRLKFGDQKNGAPFPSVVVVFGKVQP
jgi:phage N-6-adenine-methyltransferase